MGLGIYYIAETASVVGYGGFSSSGVRGLGLRLQGLGIKLEAFRAQGLGFGSTLGNIGTMENTMGTTITGLFGV